MTKTRPPQRKESSGGLARVAAIAALVFGGYYYLTEMNPSFLSSVGVGREPTAEKRKAAAAVVVAQVLDPASVASPSAAAVIEDKVLTLNLRVVPAGGSLVIRMNGSPITSQGNSLTVPLDRSFEISIDRAGFEPFQKSIVYDSQKMGAAREATLDVELIPSKYGFLSVNTTPSAEGIIFIDGGEEHIQTPFSGKRLPVGTYKVRLENKLLQMSKEISVVIEENRVRKIEERLGGTP